ncbi:selenide, water dikinase SelD [Jannaschia pohangensis]|uniref:Selenophosphate synthase n=1 Tax=Jannaschia pohangensis TaxID=390807 RepID=A0A1I3N169_9RHOB|nr:selenide, water dikinase SelD [Jannaschia pohangensis]SFJ02941.1 selenophosphate synthase [Jannaschia pohangensis]
MTPDHPLTRDLVLVGGGHTHALVLRQWGMAPQAGVRLTVINPGPTAPYSGMLPGHVAGHYSRDDLDIDLVRLARFAGARLIDGFVTDVDAGAQVLTVSGRGKVPYDVASLDVGINAEMPRLPGFAEHGIPAKPLGAFASRWQAFLDAGMSGQVAVIGGGVAGVELAMAAAHALRARGRTPEVTVIEAAKALAGTGLRARQRLLAAMKAEGVTLRDGVSVARVAAEQILLEGGEAVASDFTIGAAGARPHDWLADTSLPLDGGFVRVGPTLQVEGHPTLFATGDCAHMVHAPRPKAGVFAVRAAPVLHDNLRAALSSRSLRRFDPQGSYLKLISLGGKRALGEKFGAVVSGPWVWRWKDHIDRTFMDRLNDLPAMTTGAPPADAATGVGETGGKMMCAGCGSKVSGPALASVLANLPPPMRDDVLSRPGDDAAVLARGAGRQVFTTDHLRAFTADPATFARIAAIHALGDIWAMGARPQAALATVILPRASEPMQARLLDEVMTAASEVLSAAGADLVGGHSLMGAEISLGFSLTGLCEGEPIGLTGARPGDAMILTKPIGTGTILAADMALRARGADVLALLAAMAVPQDSASAILARAGVGAMTDVTGFGLAGHLSNICRASGVGAEIVLADVPLYSGAEDLAASGIRSTLHAANAAAAPVEGGTGPRLALLHDPQTAGGLLATVPEIALRDTMERLADAGVPAVRIGTITDGPVRILCR